jgi:cytochrome c oxidase cbb3-type subunit 3
MSSPPPSDPKLRDHVYDGIQEYDQKLPNWWLFSWYITMVWFVIAWFMYYQLGVGESDIQKVDRALAHVEKVRLQELAAVNDDKLWAMSQDPRIVAAGAATYSTACVACHAPDLSAQIAGARLPGLPLNDSEWKHGGHPLQVLTVVRKGSPDVTKGMPPWEPQLGLQRVIEVVAFVLSKHRQDEPVKLAPDSPLRSTAAQ